MGADDEENPFRLPPDDQIFLLREQERQRRMEERETVKYQKVWEKTTASSRVHRNRRVGNNADDAHPGVETAARSESVGRDTRREKENVSDFVAKKREMFLVQMSLDVKKAEILKLDEKAKQKEEALKKSQQMLEEDATRFDAFLQNNDQKAHKAMKNAEDMTKKKQDRMQKIKQLKSQVSAIQSEIAKHREQKDECIKFKGFLEKLTPQEWKDRKAEEKRERKRLRKKSWVERHISEANQKMQEEIEAEERSQEEKEKETKTGHRRQRREKEEEAKEREKEMEARRRRIRRKYRTAEDYENEYQEVSSGDEMPLYFEEPKQLLDVFTSLEESNLFLIQNSQDTEQALEELQQKFAEMRRTGDAKTGKVKSQIGTLERQIAEERATCEELRQKVSQKHGGSEQGVLLRELAEKVEEVHAACGHEAEHDPDALAMLAAVESKLEEFLEELDKAEAGGYAAQVEALERAKDKDRRELNKRQRKEEQDRRTEERLKASLQRSQAPIHKKVGKQIMFRSAPLFQARRVEQDDDGFEDAVKEHEVFGIWINKDGIPNASQPSKPT